MAPSKKRGRLQWTLAQTLVAIVLVHVAAYYLWFGPRQVEANERCASAALKSLASAEADFRANDRDGNRVTDFWTADVSGLYALEVNGKPLALIAREVGEADATPNRTLPGGPKPHCGYYFIALERDESEPGGPISYKADTDGSGRRQRHTSKFGFCAYPAVYGKTGRLTYILNEGNTMFRGDFGGRPVLNWPRDDIPASSFSG